MNMPLDDLRGTTFYSKDGSSRIFTVYFQEDVASSWSFLKEMLPHWWTDDIRLIGHFTDGDIIVAKGGRIVLIDHDSLEIATTNLTEWEFYTLLIEKDPKTVEKVYSSAGRHR